MHQLASWPPFFSARLAGWAALVLLAACGARTPESLIASGKAFSADNDPAAAIIQYKAALQLDLASTEARILLGKALVDTGDLSGAIVELSKALDDKAPASDVLPTLAKALVLSGGYRKLVVNYGNVQLEDKAARAEFKSQLALAWGELGDRAKAVAAVEAALLADPTNGPASMLKARLLAGEGKFDEATALVDQTLARNEKYPDAWLLRGELLNAVKKDPVGAEAAFRRAIGLDNTYLPGHAAVIGMRLRAQDLPGAKTQADRMRDAAPKHPYVLLVDAQLAYVDGQLARSRELVQRLLQAFPDQEDALVLAGIVESQLGSTVLATTYLVKALQINPALEPARLNLAEVEVRMGQHKKALETLKPLLAAQRPRVGALALAGNAELLLGNAEAAEKRYLQAAKLDPSNPRLQTAAVMSRLAAGDAALALAELESLSKSNKETYADEALFAARMKRREFDAALAALDGMAKKQPNKASHLELRSRVHLARRDLPAARQSLEQALKLDPGLYSAVASLTYIDLLENKPNQAMARVQAAVDANPRNSVALIALAEMKARNGAAVPEVKKLLVDAIAASPLQAEQRLKLIEFTLRKRQYKEALAAAQDAIAALPGNLSLLEALGQAQLQAGNVEQAANTYRRLASALPDSPQPYLRLAEIYKASGEREKSLTAINKALEVAPGLLEAQVALIDALSNASQSRNALEYVSRIKKSSPHQPQGYSLEALYHARRNDNEAALNALREGTARTNSSELAGKLFSHLLKMGRTAEAEKFGASWIKQHPADAAFEYLLSVSDISRGDLRSAEARLRRVVAAYPNNVMALNNLSWVLVQTGGKNAIDYAQRALDLAPDQPELMDTLAMALAADKQVGAALDMQKRALELAPEKPGLRLGLARIALQAGEKQLAREELNKLGQLGAAFASHEEVKKLMQAL
ncbi:MAG: PEP-CTERM system TPR-repeat protein PrsT [Rubrivivax sp.]|nr:PEP-CTERM system TPR-repeat protein PrsT [Rubrivivax sp.]